VVSLSVLVFAACESTDDVLNRIDHTVPSVLFSSDTLESAPGESVVINAVIEDESGIQRIEFTYGDWRINKIVDLSSEAATVSTPFTLEIMIPENAVKSWEENQYFNDGTSIKITQQYHRLTLSAWDKNRNLNKRVVYLKVRT
jgi:hypothetical protein